MQEGTDLWLPYITEGYYTRLYNTLAFFTRQQQTLQRLYKIENNLILVMKMLISLAKTLQDRNNLILVMQGLISPAKTL
jgi:hypothetical protein